MEWQRRNEVAGVDQEELVYVWQSPPSFVFELVHENLRRPFAMLSFQAYNMYSKYPGINWY